MGLTPPNVSDIVRGRLKGYTLDRLFACLNALDQDIEIVIRPKREANRRGHVVVSINRLTPEEVTLFVPGRCINPVPTKIASLLLTLDADDAVSDLSS